MFADSCKNKFNILSLNRNTANFVNKNPSFLIMSEKEIQMSFFLVRAHFTLLEYSSNKEYTGGALTIWKKIIAYFMNC